jgi:multidrug resistance efflux pump
MALKPATVTTLARVGGVILVVSVVTSAALARRVVAPDDEGRHARVQSAVGLIRPGDVTSVTLPAAGSVAEVLVAVGDEVKDDQPLARVTLPDGRHDLAQLIIDVERAQQEVLARERDVIWARQAIERLQNGDPASQLARAEREAQQVPMRQAKDSPDRAYAAWEAALLRQLRFEQLAAAGLVARQDADEAQAAYRVASDDLTNAMRAADAAEQLRAAEAAQTKARRGLSLAESQKQLGDQQAALGQARLQLRQAQLRQEAARSKTGESVIRVQRSGTVVDLPIHAGDRLPEGTLIARIASLDPLTIDIDIEPLLVNTLKVGGPAQVNVPAIHLVNQTAKIRTIAPLPADNGKYPVQLTVANPARARLAGQTAEVTLSGEPALLP